ncbi:MAG: hypothetical protein KAJ42_06175 [Gemmatimonadetes bacterium]|nr:hypothetical protein [Gemmatimonadota bacterium]
MTAMTRFQITVLARLLARDVSGAAMKIDCRSLDALKNKGLVEYCGETSNRTEDGRTRHTQASTEKTTAVTDRGRQMFKDDRRLRDEVEMHLRVEIKIALEKASSYETTARMLRRRAGRWDDAHSELP